MEFDVDELIARRRNRTPLFAGSRKDPDTGHYYNAPDLPPEETEDN